MCEVNCCHLGFIDYFTWIVCGAFILFFAGIYVGELIQYHSYKKRKMKAGEGYMSYSRWSLRGGRE